MDDEVGRSGEILCIYMKCTTTPLAEAFFQATTADLNVVSWKKAFSFFPYSTLVEQEGLLLQDLDNVVDPDEKPVSENLIALSQAGFKTKAMPWEKAPKRLTDLRKVSDAKSWVIELGMGGITPSSVPDAVLEANTFRLHSLVTLAEPKPDHIPHYTVHCRRLFHHPVLKYSYMGCKDDWRVQELDEQLNLATKVELGKLPVVFRPP
jgi:hypothetical protein